MTFVNIYNHPSPPPHHVSIEKTNFFKPNHVQGTRRRRVRYVHCRTNRRGTVVHVIEKCITSLYTSTVSSILDFKAFSSSSVCSSVIARLPFWFWTYCWYTWRYFLRTEDGKRTWSRHSCGNDSRERVRLAQTGRKRGFRNIAFEKRYRTRAVDSTLLPSLHNLKF